MTEKYILFGAQSLLGFFLFAILVWKPISRKEKVVRIILLVFVGLAILFSLAASFFLNSFWNSNTAAAQEACLDLLIVLWPAAFCFLWRWKALSLKFQTLRVIGILFLGLFVGTDLWYPIPAILNEPYMPHDVKVEKASPQNSIIATIFFRYGPSMFNDGETYLNLRRKGTPFHPADYFHRHYLEDNPANIMIVTGYDAHYEPIDLVWVDETHLKVLVPGYDKLSKNSWADYDHYAALFEKKKERWENVEIKYGDKGK